jgi:hypothetical protein
MMFDVAAAQDGSGPQAAGARPSDAAVRVTQLEGNAPKVSFRWENIGVENAFVELFKATNQSFLWAGRLDESVPITATMESVDLKTALDLICQVAGLTYEQRNGAWVISQGPQMVTVGGMRVPVVGAVPGVPGESVFERRVGDETLLFTNPRIVRETGVALGPVLGSPARVDFPGSETLIDLDVKDTPLSEVVAKLSAAVNVPLAQEAQKRRSPVQAANHVEIIAHESLKNVRVTARVYRWPAGQLLAMLIEQTGVVCSEEVEEPLTSAQVAKQVGPGGGVVRLRRTVRIHLVPKPMLEVTGPGIPEPGSRGVGGGGGGGGRAGGGGGGGRAGGGGGGGRAGAGG